MKMQAAGDKSFERSVLVVKEKPKLADPVLLVGLPGIGLVSKLAADNLVRVLGAKHFATLYSPHFPNQVLALQTGRLRLFSMKFYYARPKGAKRDFIIVRGDLQPLTVEGQYEVCGRILSFSRELGASLTVAMAGYAINSVKEKPAVYCTSTSKKLLKKLLGLGGKLNDNVVPIVGMAGMLPGLARLYSMKGTCLLVETPGPIADANGAKMLTELVGKLFGVKVDTARLSKQAQKAAKLVEQFQKQVQKAAEEAGALPGAAPARQDLTYIR